jgi:hypothetical protein
MRVAIGLVLLLLAAVVLWPRVEGFIPFRPGPIVRIKWHLQDPVAYKAGRPASSSRRLQDLVRMLEMRLRNESRATVPVLSQASDANTTPDGNELTFVDLSFITDAAHIIPNDYSAVRPIAILAVDPYVLSIPSELPYRSLDAVLDVAGYARDGTDASEGIHIAPSNVNGFSNWMWVWPTLDALARERGRKIAHYGDDLKDDEDVRWRRLSAALDGRAHVLIVSTLSQVFGVLGNEPHRLRPLAICDEHALDVGHMHIPPAGAARVDCPLMPFIAVVINKKAGTRAEEYWRRELSELSESAEWRAALDGQGLLPRLLVAQDAQAFLDNQLKIAASLYTAQGRIDTGR